MARALGVDVGVRKGLDLVALDDHGTLLLARRRATTDDLEDALDVPRPDVVAIDSPPAWSAPGRRSRRTEAALRRAGIHSFGTPDADRGEANRFYEWMRSGF